MLNISTKFCEIILNGSPKITKGNNSAKNVAGVTIVDVCTSSGHAYICAKFVKLSPTVTKLWRGYE